MNEEGNGLKERGRCVASYWTLIRAQGRNSKLTGDVHLYRSLSKLTGDAHLYKILPVLRARSSPRPGSTGGGIPGWTLEQMNEEGREGRREGERKGGK